MKASSLDVRGHHHTADVVTCRHPDQTLSGLDRSSLPPDLDLTDTIPQNEIADGLRMSDTSEQRLPDVTSPGSPDSHPAGSWHQCLRNLASERYVK